MKHLFLIFFMLITGALIAQNWEEVQIETTKVSDNIYMLKGAGGNIGVIAGDDGVMIVDNQFAHLLIKSKLRLPKSLANQ